MAELGVDGEAVRRFRVSAVTTSFLSVKKFIVDHHETPALVIRECGRQHHTFELERPGRASDMETSEVSRYKRRFHIVDGSSLSKVLGCRRFMRSWLQQISQAADLRFTNQKLDTIIPNGDITEIIREARNQDLAYSGECEFRFSLHVERRFIITMASIRKACSMKVLDNNASETTEECVICLQDMAPSEATDNIVVELPECKHAFHNVCIFKWFETGVAKCPPM
ncbi:hypothetical protein QYE76_037232 [Lolium multiflorum]|uniref:RING-type domain-containing protein n=1 Tax=Lolium multiflorum TaxID=4521 RepID=A0AAD8QKQ5_LOLMU|nr:hypothetical protein QYE76_037232 [Lolium multiflorum]